MDERQELNAGRAAMITLMVVCLGALGVLVWDYLQDEEVTNTGAIIVLLGSGGLFWLFNRMFGAEAPRSVLGHELPTGPTPEEKAVRRRSYALDAGLFSVALAVLSVGGLLLGDTQGMGELPAALQGTTGLVVGALLSLVAGFVVFFGLNYLGGEQQARAVERKLARLENA